MAERCRFVCVGQMISCMALADQDPCKWNFYTDKSDATAWNDWGGLPRKVMYPNFTDHRCDEGGEGG
jgi:hypothetical protein